MIRVSHFRVAVFLVAGGLLAASCSSGTGAADGDRDSDDGSLAGAKVTADERANSEGANSEGDVTDTSATEGGETGGAGDAADESGEDTAGTSGEDTAGESGDESAAGTADGDVLGDLADAAFVEDFEDGDAMSKFDFGIYHRDDVLMRHTEWPADHPMAGPDDVCGPPTETRVVQRGERDSGFNDEWIYRCVPGGDLAKAHVMTSIGHTSGYSIGGFAPVREFSDVREVRWDVNQTDLGDRQWTEVVLIPVDRFDFQELPCLTGLPCDTVTHAETGSVGTHWAGKRSRRIVTPDEPSGYGQAGGDLGYRCKDCPYAPGLRFGEAYGEGDPALTSVAIRRKNYFRDNGDGTLTWGFELDDGSFHDFTVPGSFPPGRVKVVFKDHNYTPLKSPATLLPETTFTWHWDNIAVFADEVPS